MSISNRWEGKFTQNFNLWKDHCINPVIHYINSSGNCKYGTKIPKLEDPMAHFSFFLLAVSDYIEDLYHNREIKRDGPNVMVIVSKATH